MAASASNKEIFGFLNVALAALLNFYPIQEKDFFFFFFFLSISVVCTSRFFPIHERVKKFGFLKSQWFNFVRL